MIQISNITVRFGEKAVLENIHWNISDRSRIGLVGDNGSGKTTLFRAITGMVQPEAGSIEISKGHCIGYLPQEATELEPVGMIEYMKKKAGLEHLERALHESAARLAEMEPGNEGYGREAKKYESAMHAFHVKDGYAFESKCLQVLKGLGFSEADRAKKCSEFSGGWKMRIVLASILLSVPDIMLLDEPTNHLDTESMEWLEDFLRQYDGTIITVAHDRMFLDKMVTGIAELSRGALTLYKGNFSYYEREKQRRKEAQEEEYLRQQKEIKRIQVFVDRFRAKASKASQVQSRLKMLEKIETVRVEKDAKTVTIRFPECTKSGLEVIKTQGLSKAYGALAVFNNITFTVYRQDKIALIGVNGAGKSTLLRLISRAEAPTGGTIDIGRDVRMAYFSQESALNLDYTKTVWEEITAVPSPCLNQEKRNFLGAFLFSGDDIYKPINVLSGGEKSRLSLLKILLHDSNVLVLDEPTNHLDMKTKGIFHEALLQYRGTVLIVSHDRSFLDSLVGRVLEIRDGHMYEYLGNYSYFIQKRAQQAAAAPPAGARAYAALPVSKETKRHEAEERNRLYGVRSSLKRKLEAVERKIAALEGKKALHEQALCGTDIYKNPDELKRVSQELKAIPTELDRLYHEWNGYADRMTAAG